MKTTGLKWWQIVIIFLTFAILVGLLCILVPSSQNGEPEKVYDVDPVYLYFHYKDYEGEYVRFAGLFETIIPEHNAMTFAKGFDDYRQCIYVTFEKTEKLHQPEDYSNYYVQVVGKVKDRGLGNLNIMNAKIEAIGKDAEDFYKAHKQKTN